MKSISKKHKISFIVSALIITMTVGSCESYLDKAPESTITEKDAFGNFVSFQGFVEEMYNCVTDYNKAGAPNRFLYADETLTNGIFAEDNGDFFGQQSLLLYGTSIDAFANNSRGKRIWPLCWYGIRKANMALSKLDLMVDATQEEKDLIKGQALFFRGWFYFELMRYWGGLPYIEKVLEPEDNFKIPRLNYRETALKAAKDLEDAIPLLPVNWDETQAGQATLGNNRQRISKIMALSYLGKDLLYAASPMMNEESTGINSYDAELCKKAAATFAEAIRISDETGMFKLQTWPTWTDNFWVWSVYNQKYSGGTEVIMNPLVFNQYTTRWGAVSQWTTPRMGSGYNPEVPTHNILKNYGMANGLPIDDPLSGYNPDDPWTNREPRFYVDITIDGDKVVVSNAAGLDQYIKLYNGGRHRVGYSTGSATGYFLKKFAPIGCNNWDNKWANFQMAIPYMRLADVYLMYAEAVLHGYGTPQSSVPGSITAEQAVNIIRNRAQLPDLTAPYNSTKDAFMQVIIRERAVELGFEAHRFHDLRRWNLFQDPKYKDKTAIDFDRGTNGKPINIKERTVITRVAEKKHNWFPFQVSFTTLYPEFKQNPGW